MKKLKRILKHFLVPHRGNAYRPHALRHKMLSFYSIGLILSHLAFGTTLYAGPIALGDTNVVKENIIVYSNMEREKAGAGRLYESKALNKAAEMKLKDMFQKNYWDHVGPSGETAWDFFDQNGYRYSLAGENLARGFTSSKEVVQAWMNSPSHRENILNQRFKEIGIAAGTGKIKGQSTTVIVQLFGEPKMAVASETKGIYGTQKIMPEFSPEVAASPSKAPYWIAWVFIFGLIVLDGVMIRRLGLHCSKSHVFNFRVSLLMSVIGLALLMFGFVAIA